MLDQKRKSRLTQTPVLLNTSNRAILNREVQTTTINLLHHRVHMATRNLLHNNTVGMEDSPRISSMAVDHVSLSPYLNVYKL